MKESQDDQEPVTPFERNFYILLMTIILALFVAEIVRDYHPSKLSVLFFVLFWPPLMVLHEAGHAMMASLLGWQVRLVVIGFNREIRRFPIRGVQVVVNLIPLGGFVIPGPRTLNGARVKLALIYFAGPGIELLLLGILVLAFGPDLLLTSSERIGVIAAQALAVAILVGVVINLMPIPYPMCGRFSPSDGLGIIRAFVLPWEKFIAQIGYHPRREEAEPEWWERGDEGWASDRDPDRWR